MGWNWPEVSERLTILVMCGTWYIRCSWGSWKLATYCQFSPSVASLSHSASNWTFSNFAVLQCVDHAGFVTADRCTVSSIWWKTGSPLAVFVSREHHPAHLVVFRLCFFYKTAQHWFLIFSERELTFTFAICYRPSVCRLSVVCNVRVPYSGGWNFRQYFYGVRYLGHSLTSTKNFMEIIPGEPLRRGSWTQEG